MKKNTKNSSVSQYLLVGVVFLLGIGIGYSLPRQSKSIGLASEAEIQIAKNSITKLYLNQSSLDCKDPSDPITPQDRVAVFETYLKVNKYANRAVIRGCNDIDNLLAKTNNGDWVITDVNISLDTRANPKWQKECWIDDITTADDTIRPENSWIDEMNYELCEELRSLQ